MTDHLVIDGRRLEVADSGPDGAGPAVVFLHEALGSVGLWRGVPDDLAAATGRRVVSFSRFGHGASDPPRGPRTRAFFAQEALEVLPAVLDALGLAEPVLVGHSDGATIALLHAARHRVTGAAVLAPHVFVEDVTVTGIRAVRDAYATGLRDRMARHHRDADALFEAWSDLWLDEGFRDWDVVGELRTIAAPLLLVQGREDEYGTMAQIDAIQRAVAGPARRLELDCGHAPHLERRAEVLAALVAFVLGGGHKDRAGTDGGGGRPS